MLLLILHRYFLLINGITVNREGNILYPIDILIFQIFSPISTITNLRMDPVLFL